MLLGREIYIISFSELTGKIYIRRMNVLNNDFSVDASSVLEQKIYIVCHSELNQSINVKSLNELTAIIIYVEK